MRILVADDDPTLREELAELLVEEGHSVRVASDGGEAMGRLEAEPFDAALLDLMMPGATGLEILKRLQNGGSRTAVVLITGHGSIDVAVEAMKSGAADFLVKPFEIDALRRALQTIADERRAREMFTRPGSSPEARRAVVEEAAGRKALLAVVGPNVRPPRGAARVLRIDEAGRPPDVFTPTQLYQLNTTIDAFLAGAERPVVYAADLALLERLHGPKDLRAWVRHIAGRCAARGGVLVVSPPNPSLASEFDASRGEEEVTEPGIQGMLESLANPIRRGIVSYVFSSGPAAYSAILRMKFVDSSSKLSFHLQKLLADGLLAKNDRGAYGLTEDGRRAWRVVRALSEERRPPAVLFDVP